MATVATKQPVPETRPDDDDQLAVHPSGVRRKTHRTPSGGRPPIGRIPRKEDTRPLWAQVLSEYLNFMRIPINDETAATIGISRQALNDRITGKSRRITADELELMADVFEFPSHLFLLPKEELIEWLLENRSDYFR
jgi:hypothetical protein